MPEILPFLHTGITDKHEKVLCQGIWADIPPEEWRANLYIDKISTIYNRNKIHGLILQVWFRRHQNSLHGCIPFTKSEIIAIQKVNQSYQLFYHFIAAVYQTDAEWIPELMELI